MGRQSQSHNAVVSRRFVFHVVPNPGTLVVPACTSHPKQSSLGDRPIYDFHYNIHFSMHRLHCVRPKPPTIA